MFTTQEYKALMILLDRVSLTGKEAETMVFLKNKIKRLTEEPAQPEVGSLENKPKITSGEAKRR